MKQFQTICFNTKVIPDPTAPPITAPPPVTTAVPVVTIGTIATVPADCVDLVNPSTDCVDLVNPSTGVSDCPSRAYLCTNSFYYDLMTTQCPRTCGRCTTNSTTCVDKINAKTGTSDCSSMRSYCNDSTYYALMTEQCPNTCGRCSSTSSSTTATTSKSAVIKRFEVLEKLGLACVACVDKINASTGKSDCANMASYCNNPQYYTLMTEQCPRTCNRCSITSSSTASTCT
ncbi:unnamed protein product [Strongylus vulgaris]|uniref:ShKT domain-containing protein n=1 Tax=Strongylus vulgaris TaxID=40348 RepID=A0A3P7L732_STRVU|nr:unnamed protein product [Strongylus vulgaris]